MRSLLLLAAVLLSSSWAAKVPSTVADNEVSRVTLQVPLNTPHHHQQQEVPVVAHVVEVSPSSSQRPLPHVEPVGQVGQKPGVIISPVHGVAVGHTGGIAVNEPHVENQANLMKHPASMRTVRAVTERIELQVPLVTKVPEEVIKATESIKLEPVVPIEPVESFLPTVSAVAKPATTTTVASEDDATVRTVEATVASTATVPTSVLLKRTMSAVVPPTVPQGKTIAQTENPCDLQCTKLDLNPVCASNGECVHEFPNQCVMDTFICLHPHMGFTHAKGVNSCQSHRLKLCTEKDLMG